MNNEEWKEIPGYDGIYAASNFGRIRRNAGFPDRRGHATPGGMLKLTTTTNPRGYRQHVVNLWGKARRVHQLVALAWLGPCPPREEVRHINGDATDNRIANLAYGTHKENVADTRKHERDPLGSRHGMAKLNEELIERIRAEHDGKRGTGAKLASKYNVSASTVSFIKNRRTWRHVNANA